MTRRFLIFLQTSLCVVAIQMVQPLSAAQISLKNTTFKHLSAEDGLSQKTVPTIFQDSAGYMWFGTQDGLNRYDGKSFHTFKHSSIDKQSISHDYIYDILEDSRGNLLIATGSGLNLYNAHNETFELISLDPESSQPIDKMSVLFKDGNGVIWVGTNRRGLYRLQYKQSNLVASEYKGFRDYDIRAILKDSRNRIWVGTETKGVILIDGAETTNINKSSTGIKISHDRIRTIFEDFKGRIWIGTRGGGLNRFNEITKKFSFYQKNEDQYSLSHNRVYTIFQDKQYNLWIGTDGGINLYREKTDDFTSAQNKASQKYSLSNNRVYSIHQDSGGLMWFGTLAGINIWNPRIASFNHYRKVAEDKVTLSDNSVMSIYQSNNEQIYVGTFNGGLNILDPQSKSIGPAFSENQNSPQRIMSMMVDAKNNLWLGTMSDGVKIYSEDLNEIGRYENSPADVASLSANGVTDIYQDSDGDIWVATYLGGLNRLNQSEAGFRKYGAKGKANEVLLVENTYQVLEDDEGYIWIATDGGGIARLDKHTNQIINIVHDSNNGKSLSGNASWSIFQDSKGRFWIGTQGHGLNRWEATNRRQLINEFKHYSMENGLSSSTVYGVLEDEYGFIWISTNKGVSRLNPETDEMQHYNLADEIHYNEFNQGAFFKARDGQLIFGGLDGLSSFYPNDISPNLEKPRVILTTIKSENNMLYFDEPAHKLSEIEIDHKDYLVSFEFVSLDFSQPQKNQYMYKLEGFDPEWIHVGTLNRATFTNLPSGTYVLKVKGTNSDGTWSDESVNLRVNVLPAPWFSWWAFSIYGGFFCLVILFVIRFQARKLANQELFKERVSGEVEEKTALYLSNNEYLERQLARAKHQSFFDADANLPNQRFMMTQLSPLIQLLSLHEEGLPARKLMISLIGFKATANVSRESAAQCFSLLAKEKESTQTLASWGSEALFCQEVLSEDAEGQASLNLLVNSIHAKVNVSGISDICYVAFELPFSGVQTSPIESDEYLMLLEHLLYLVAHSQQHSSFYITGALQNLNSSKIRQILDSKDIAEIDELFILKSA